MEEKELLDLIAKNALKVKIERAKTGNTTILDKIRKEIFVKNQKISVLKKWFNIFWEVELTKEELAILKSIIVKPKSTKWELVFKIIVHQKQLSQQQIEEWFSYIKPYDRLPLAFDLIKAPQLKNDNFKIALFKELLIHKEYMPRVIQAIDMSLMLESSYIWEQYFNVLVDYINDNNDLSKKIIFYWKKTVQLDTFAKEKNVSSTVLYNETKKDQYLPQEAKDIFFF